VRSNGAARLRLLVGSWLLAGASLGLGLASIALVRPAPDLRLASGRHLLAGALANVALAGVLFVLALGPVRRGRFWAIALFALPAVLYGVPVLAVDAWHVAPDRRVATLAPQVAGLLALVIGGGFAVSGARTLDADSETRNSATRGSGPA
jgi:hypothetical protein